MFGSVSCEFIDFESLLINNKDFSEFRVNCKKNVVFKLLHMFTS